VKPIANHIKIYNDLFILYGQNLTLKSHANHGIKLILCEEEVALIHERKQHRALGLVVKSDLTHHIKANDRIGITIFLDPETEIGHLLKMLFRKNKIIKLENNVSVSLFKYFNHVVHNHSLESDIINHLQLTFGHAITGYRKIDSRIERVIAQIINEQSESTQFVDLLKLSSLSASRLLHLFKKEVGIPIRRYILWCKTKRALTVIASGTTIKKAASIAGFTDAAHFNRSFLSMFGNSPSNLVK
jgi:AraC-like DNA-binding protein